MAQFLCILILVTRHLLVETEAAAQRHRTACSVCVCECVCECEGSCVCTYVGCLFVSLRRESVFEEARVCAIVCAYIHAYIPPLRKANHPQCLQWLRALFSLSLPWGPLIEARIPPRVCVCAHVCVCVCVGLDGIALDKRDALASSCGEDSSSIPPPLVPPALPLPASLGPVRQPERRWRPAPEKKRPLGRLESD